MSKQSMQLDPEATSYTDDEIVGKVNAATANITRVSSVASAARPLVDGEVTNVILASGVTKENLDAISDTERGYVNTDPQPGEFKVLSIQRTEGGQLEADYDDVPMPS